MINYNRFIQCVKDKNSNDGFKRIGGKVKSVDSKNEYAIVELVSGTIPMKFVNKTGEKLLADDSVWIYYYNNNLTAGYIGLRNGCYSSDKISSNDINKIVVLTQSQYDGLENVDSTVMYVIVG